MAYTIRCILMIVISCSLGRAAIVSDVSCASGFLCRPLSQCSVFYADFARVAPQSCPSLDGVLSICCPDVQNVQERVAKFLQKTELRSNLGPLPTPLLEQTWQSARIDLLHMNQVEQRLSLANMMNMNSNSMAYGHSSNMEPSVEAAIQSAKGLLIVNAIRRLQDSLKLSPDQAGSGLQALDTRATSLADVCLPSPICLPSKYRSHEGTCNNLENPNWGRSLTPLERILPPVYWDGIWAPKIDSHKRPLPNVRVVRSIVATDENHPAVGITHMTMQWGQFIDHDMTHVPSFITANQSMIECCTPDGGIIPPELRHPHCFPIDILPEDPFYGPRGVRCLNFVRSAIAPRADCRFGYADQLNQLTHFIDASQIYGSTTQKARSLREGVGGRMLFSVVDGRVLLPQTPRGGGCVKAGQLPCFVAGDSRSNQVPGLAALHVLFLRQHNNFAAQLSILNPVWDDEKLYQEARRIVAAILQHITYNEFLPVVLGRATLDAYGLTPQTTSYSGAYDGKVNPSITNEFATAAYRMGHSLIQPTVNFIEEDGTVSVELLRTMFDNPHFLRLPGRLNAVLRGLTADWSQDNDEWVVNEVTNHLFQSPKRDHGFDLVSLNLWRGRDHGLQGYNDYRVVCGLPRAVKFDQLLDTMPKEVVAKLASLYASVDDVDLYIGGLVERHLPGSLLGPVFSCIIADQFARLKQGDRFFYEFGPFPHSFTPLQLQEIRRVSLAAIICDNSDGIGKMQPLAFRDPSVANPRVACGSPLIPRMNMLAWKE